MPWVRIDDALGDDPRVATAGAAAVGVLVLALCHSNRNLTGGWVPAAIIRRSLEGSTTEAADDVITRLLQSCLLVSADRDGIPGYQIHREYVKHQPTPDEVLQKRAKRSLQKAEAGRRGGISSGQARKKQKRSTWEAEPKQTPRINEAPIPIPIPSGKSTGASAPASRKRNEDHRATHALLCNFYKEVRKDDPVSSAPDCREDVKKLCAKRKVNWTPEALASAEDAVFRQSIAPKPSVASGWTRVSDVSVATLGVRTIPTAGNSVREHTRRET